MSVDSENRKRQVVSVFNTVADGYDNSSMRFFSSAAQKLVEALKPETGVYVLDVATGTGAFATSCAQAILPNGRVVGVDLSEAMLEKATSKAVDLRLENIRFLRMDAEHLEFEDDCFDHAVCAFALFFLTDMKSALQEWSRVVKPGGKLLFTSFTRKAFMPMMEMFIQHLETFGVHFEESPIDNQKLSSEQDCLDLIASAGLRQGKVEIHQLGYHLQSEDDWWSIVSFSGLRGLLDRLDMENISEFKRSHLKSLKPMFGENGLWLDVEVLLSQGQAPLQA